MHATPVSSAENGVAGCPGPPRQGAAGTASAKVELAAVRHRQELVPQRRAAGTSEGPVERPPRTRRLTTLPPTGRHAAHRYCLSSRITVPTSVVTQAYARVVRRNAGELEA